MMISNFQYNLVKSDLISDRIPLVSTVTNLIDIFQKCLVLPLLTLASSDTVKKSYYYTHLNQKSLLRCIVLCIPIIGNIYIALQKNKPKYQMKTSNSPFSDGQGFTENSAYSHRSTVPPEYYQKKYPRIDRQFLIDSALDPNEDISSMSGLNMDRGGFIERQDGTVAACLCDGVGGGGIFSMHAAQAFTNAALRYLQTTEAIFYSNNQKLGERLFNLLVNAPGPAYDNQTGAATCVVATTRKLSKGKFRVAGAAIGDSVAIRIDSNLQQLEQLNIVQRKNNKANDSGGQIEAGTKVWDADKISEFSTEAAPKDIIILASDGLTDNIASLDLIPIIVRSPRFDHEIQEERALPTLPLREELEPFCVDQVLPAPATVVHRLNNYVEWVTRARRRLESEGLQKEMSASSESDRKSNAKIQEIEKILKSDQAPCGKTDDVMIIAFHPGN